MEEVAWDGWESADDLLAYAAAAGHPVTRTQLIRWHKRGLLPRPRARYFHGRKGAETYYPPGTSAVLLQVCELTSRTKSLDAVAWQLWWAGHDRNMDEVRDFMANVFADLERTLAKVRKAVTLNEKYGKSNLTVRRYMNESPDLPAPLGTMRRRLNWGDRQEFPVLVDSLLRAMLGDASPPSDDEINALDRALRFDEGRVLPLRGSAGWNPAPDGAALTWMANFMSQPLAKTLASASDHDLVIARDRAIALISFTTTFGETMSSLFPRSGLGWGFIGKAMDRLTSNVKNQAFIVLVLHAFRGDSEFGDPFAEIQNTIDEWNADGYANWNRIRFLTEQLPELRTVLSESRIREAFKSPRGFDSLAGEVVDFRMDHAADIDALVIAHPEIFGIQIASEPTEPPPICEGSEV